MMEARSEVRIEVNGEPQALLAATIADLLAQRGVNAERGVAVALNGAVVRRAEWANTALRPGDAVEIVQAKQGG